MVCQTGDDTDGAAMNRFENVKDSFPDLANREGGEDAIQQITTFLISSFQESLAVRLLLPLSPFLPLTSWLAVVKFSNTGTNTYRNLAYPLYQTRTSIIGQTRWMRFWIRQERGGRLESRDQICGCESTLELS
jgi:hypothetical protein